MVNIVKILKEHASDLTEDQVTAIEKAVAENYRSKEETDKKATRIEELETANEELSKLVKDLEVDGEQFEALKAKVQEFEETEKERTAQAEEQAKRDSFRTVFDAAIGDRQFANDIIRETIFDKVYSKCSETTGLDAKRVIDDMTKDTDGIWVNPQKSAKKMPKGGELTDDAKKTEEDAKKAFAAKLFGGND